MEIGAEWEVNLQALDIAIVRAGITKLALAERIGINEATLYRKLASKGEKFTVGEMHSIMSTLGLSAEDGAKIFLYKRPR